MGIVRNLAGWIVVAVILVVFAVVAAVATGYIMIGDPGTAVAQVATGNVTAPNTSIENVRYENAGGDIGPGGLSSQVTMRFDLVIDNGPNAVGGSIDVVDYDVAISEEPDGPFEHVGSGRIPGVTVPPGERVTEESTFTMQATDMAQALGGSLDAGSDRYTRISGNATVGFGPFSFSVPFEQVSRMEAGTMAGG